MSSEHKTVQKIAQVASFAYGPDMFFADKHEQLPVPEQYQEFKSSYRESSGKFATLSLRSYGEVSANYEGQQTIFTSSNSLINEYSFGQEYLHTKISNQIPKAMNQNSINVNNAVICLPGGGYNIHHFVLEILPALILFKEEIRNFEFLVLGGFQTSTFIKEFCEIFFPTLNLIVVKPNSFVTAEESALLNSFPYKIYPWEIIDEIGVTLRRFAAEKSTNSKVLGEALLFSRGDQERDRRKLVNQEKILNKLQMLGKPIHTTTPALQNIETTIIDSMSFNTHIGQSGGGFVHTLWGSPSTKVIELQPDGFVGNTEIYDLCRIFKREYHSVSTRSLTEDWKNSDQTLEDLEMMQLFNLIN